MFTSICKLVVGGSVLAVAGSALGQVDWDAQPKPKSPEPEYRVIKPATESRGQYGVGVAISPASAVLDSQLRLPPGTGAVVEQVVPGSPADKAGLQQYDLLVQIDDQPIRGPQQLAKMIASHSSGDEVDLVLLREGRKRTVTLRIDRRDWDMPRPKTDKTLKPLTRGFYFGKSGSDPFTVRLEKEPDGKQAVIIRTPDGKTIKKEVLPDLDKLRDRLRQDLEELDRLKAKDLKEFKELSKPGSKETDEDEHR